MIPHYYIEKRNDSFVITNRGSVVVSAKDIPSLVAGVFQLRETNKDIAVYCGAVEDSVVREEQESLSPQENEHFWRLYNHNL